MAVLLTSLLFAAPLVATQLDFAHTHPEEAPPHVHDIDGVLVSAMVVPKVIGTFVIAFVAPLVLSSAFRPFRVVLDRANPARAPPPD